jgi:hypothetical protein
VTWDQILAPAAALCAYPERLCEAHQFIININRK